MQQSRGLTTGDFGNQDTEVLDSDGSIIYDDKYITMNYKMVDLGAQSSVYIIEDPVFLD